MEIKSRGYSYDTPTPYTYNSYSYIPENYALPSDAEGLINTVISQPGGDCHPPQDIHSGFSAEAKCHTCNRPLWGFNNQFFEAFVIYTCSHSYHLNCISSGYIKKGESRCHSCSSSNDDYNNPSLSSPDPDYGKEVASNISQDNSRKRTREESASSRKKVKTKKHEMLEKLIEELSSNSSLDSITTETETPNSLGNLTKLYNDIVNTEKRTNQEIIKCYFAFGKELENMFANYKEKYQERKAQKRLNEEVLKQLPNNLSRNAVEKRIERARKIYYLFNNIGDNKIQRVKSCSASKISKFSWKDILEMKKKISENIIKLY
ncbi:hypothetical protein RclHR1_01890013 [Rhizophagus clarus]|uniref:RING-type domain-containing protein n=1 Tax=Rhizophagus clarus TaxID=94130 RepID=A0A2Z6R0I5_9GLOM|nr:hypothetical protein RclHR1_01890013 [Rhizophagus clarus]GES85517.1 hypothetical protein GLOIN_2v1511284 [Rhizophagus clarus]